MKRQVLIVLMLAMVLVIGCIATPLGPKITPEAAATVDAVTGQAEPILRMVEPWASTIPYGGLIVGGLLAGITAWRKYKPYVVGMKEIVRGIEGESTPEGNISPLIRDSLSKSTSDATKKLIRKVKADLK